MSRTKRIVYCYRSGKLLSKFESISEAAKATKDSFTAIYKSNKEQKPTKNGFLYSFEGIDEFNVERCDDCCISEDSFLLQRTREDRIKEFRKFIFQRFNQRWQYINKNAAKMEAAYVKAFLNSL